MQNVDFLELFRTFLLWSKKHSFLSKILKKVSFWLSLLKKNIWEKGRFSDKNHALTPFQNVKFFYFFWTSLFTSKKHSFLSRISKNASFWFFFGQKKNMRKSSIFCQKPWSNPFPQCQFFRVFKNFFLCGLKSILFYPEYQKMFLFVLLCSKNKIWKKGQFFDKNHGLTPFQNVNFFYFFWTSLFTSKKHSFLSRRSKKVSFSLCLLKKNIKGKGRFFDKSHELTPLQNVDFFDFSRTLLFRSKKYSFLFRISKNVSFWLSLLKRSHRKRSIFWGKPRTNPFAKCQFFSTLWELHFWGPKSFIFYPE